MILTDEEKQMRDGAEGAATAAAIDLLIRYGDALACDRLCDVRNVAGTMTQPSPVKERLVREGGWDKAFAVINLDCDTDIEVPAMRVPTCQLQHGFGPDARGVVPYPAQRIELQQDAESFYGRRGVSILATCTPYQVGNIPVRGEHIAWMESSAVIYANSVLGARTNCEGTASTGAASLTGKIPCWGNHREENRYGTHLIDVRTPVDSFLDWGMLGYFAGGVAGEEHPVITGDLGRPDLADLKHFGAAAATSGGVELYHIPGITPEAPTLEAAFGGERTPEPVPYGPAERRAVHQTLNSAGDRTDVDFVLLGCPRASVDQVRRAAAALDGRRLSPGAELWLMLPRALRDVADRSGYTEVIERAGCRCWPRSGPEDVIRPPERALGHRPTIVLIRGSLAPDGGIVKLAVADVGGWGGGRGLDFAGPAVVFDSPAESLAAVRGGQVSAGQVVVLRGQGPAGSPGMGMASQLVFALDGAGLTGQVAVVTDGQLSGLVNKGIVVGEISPEAARGGPLALVRDGDLIRIDVPARTADLDVPAAVLQRRRGALQAPARSEERGWLFIYQRLVRPLPEGAVLREPAP